MSVCDNLVSHEANIPPGHASETIKYKRVYGIKFYDLDPKWTLLTRQSHIEKYCEILLFYSLYFVLKVYMNVN